MTITIEKTQSVKHHAEFEVPEYFTTFVGWYYKVLGDKQLLSIRPEHISISDCSTIEHVEYLIKPCTQDKFIEAYCEAINAISAASGIEHLPLEMEVYND